MIIQFQPPCYVQGRQPLDQAAQSHIQPGHECLQGWGIHNLFGQPIPVCHHPMCVKNFFLISYLNLPCPSLRPFPLVLSLPTLHHSHKPHSPPAVILQQAQEQRPSLVLLLTNTNLLLQVGLQSTRRQKKGPSTAVCSSLCIQMLTHLFWLVRPRPSNAAALQPIRGIHLP